MATLDESDYARIHDIVTAAVQPLQHDLARHERAIFGNGQKGLVREVESLKTARGARTRKDWLSVGTVATLVSAVIGGVVAGLTHQQ